MNAIQEYCGYIDNNPAAVPARIRKIYTQLAADSVKADGDFVFDAKRANKPIAFIEKFCKHSKGEWAGQSVKLELFQKAFISALFGFVHRDTGLRKYREAFFMVGRKNGKSTMLAGLALYMMIADNEAGAEVYSTATKKDQAKIIFDETVNMERVIQGAKTLSLPMQKLGADLQAKRVCYNNNPILKWCLTNTGIQTDRNGNIVPIKNQSSKQRIDGTSSLLDAYVILMDKYNEFRGAL